MNRHEKQALRKWVGIVILVVGGSLFVVAALLAVFWAWPLSLLCDLLAYACYYSAFRWVGVD